MTDELSIKEIQKTINRLGLIRERYLGGTETQHGVLGYFWNDVDKLLAHITQLEEENKRLRGNENKVTLKEAAVMNCYLCSGRDSRYSQEPFFQKGHGGYVHGGPTGASGSVPCLSGELYTYIDALKKDNVSREG